MATLILSGYGADSSAPSSMTPPSLGTQSAPPTPEDVPTVPTVEGTRIVETWADLVDVEPDETVLVPVKAPMAEAVWVWSKLEQDDTPSGVSARSVGAFLLALHDDDIRGMLRAVQSILKALSRML